MKEDLIYIKRAYNMKQDFIKQLERVIEDTNGAWTFIGIIDAIQCTDMSNWNIENYLFMKYGELFISDILENKDVQSE